MPGLAELRFESDSFHEVGIFIIVFMPGVARPSFQSAGSYPAQTIMNAFL
jgi:hypothetical protein